MILLNSTLLTTSNFLFSSVYVNNCIFCKHATFSRVLIQCSIMSNHKWDDTDCDDTIHNHDPKPIACCSQVHQISESELFSSFCVGNRGWYCIQIVAKEPKVTIWIKCCLYTHEKGNIFELQIMQTFKCSRVKAEFNFL